MSSLKLKLAKQNGEPEIFYSLQGEGPHMGRPSIFIRLSKCNLNCIWCDTAYTWNWKKYDPKREMMEVTIDEALAKIQSFPCKNIVITGGEPLLQQKALMELIQKLKPNGYFFEVETNGTLKVNPKLNVLIDQYNCSPKLKSSGNTEKKRMTEALKEYSKNPKTFFKFVIAIPKDIKEIKSLAKKYNITSDRIYLMPEGNTVEALQRKMKWVAKTAIQEKMRFSSRLHIELWGDKRGV